MDSLLHLFNYLCANHGVLLGFKFLVNIFTEVRAPSKNRPGQQSVRGSSESMCSLRDLMSTYSHHLPSETPPPSETKQFFELPQHPLTLIFLLLEGIVLFDK